MAQFEVFRTDGGEVLLDCQSDLLDQLATRFVVPLLGREAGIEPARWLNPDFDIVNERLILYPQFAASIPARELKRSIQSLASERDAIVRALDMLWSGV